MNKFERICVALIVGIAAYSLVRGLMKEKAMNHPIEGLHRDAATELRERATGRVVSGPITITNESKAPMPLVVNAPAGEIITNLYKLKYDTNAIGDSAIAVAPEGHVAGEIHASMDEDLYNVSISGSTILKLSWDGKTIESKLEPHVTSPSNGWWHIEFVKP